VQTALLAFEQQPEPEHWPRNWRGVAEVCRQAAARAGCPAAREAPFCYLAHDVDFPFTEHMRRDRADELAALPGSG
jgi:hypothetical protein